MAQIASYVYTKTASYDFNLDGPIQVAFSPTGTNLGVVLNPGEFVLGAWYKVTTAFASPVPATDAFVAVFFTDLAVPANQLFARTTTQLNSTLGVWVNCIQTTTVNVAVRQTLTPQGTPSNNYLNLFQAPNANTAGALAICVLIGSTDL